MCELWEKRGSREDVVDTPRGALLSCVPTIYVAVRHATMNLLFYPPLNFSTISNETYLRAQKSWASDIIVRAE